MPWPQWCEQNNGDGHMSLAELQRTFRDALVTGHAEPLAAALVGGADPLARLAIHQRHYETSLVTALLERFPATQWLLGSQPMIDAARDFIRLHPPVRPSIAEFGEDFAAYLAGSPSGRTIPYLAEFAECDWHLGRIAVAADEEGVHRVRSAWPIDRLLAIFLGEEPPDSLVFEPGAVHLEIRGRRGNFTIARLAE